MTTIKSYTDLEQSKKLTEFLSHESADNVIVSIGDKEGVKTITMLKETLNIFRTPFADIRNTIPCWSLASLLGVIPNPSLHKTLSGWRCDSYNKEETSCILGEPSDNPVDACVAMIEKLHKLNLL